MIKMNKTNAKVWIIVTRFISVLMIIIVLLHWKALRFFGVDTTTVGFKASVIAIVIGFFLLNILSAIGLWRIKRWGFILGYITIAYTTILLSVSYVPGVHTFLLHMMPHDQARPIFVIVGNVILAVLLIVSQASLKYRDYHVK